MLFGLSSLMAISKTMSAYYEQHQVDRSALQHVERLETHIEAIRAQVDKAPVIATTAVVKAVEPQIQTLTGQNHESASDRAHINTEVNDLKADLAELKKSQDEMVKSFNGTKASFNEAKSILKQILEKQVKP
jgi:predicted  nucleic acid-binding Zn-ribbon protein